MDIEIKDNNLIYWTKKWVSEKKYNDYFELNLKEKTVEVQFEGQEMTFNEYIEEYQLDKIVKLEYFND